MLNGQQLDNAAVHSAVHVLTRKVDTGDGGSRQVTLYRLPTGGYAVQTLHRLPAGSHLLDKPVFYRSPLRATAAHKAALVVY
jgi:hypothetical protein